MKHKILLLGVLIALFSLTSVAQPYNNAIGIRLGNYESFAGITFKHFVKSTGVLEFIGYAPYHGLHLIGLYKFQQEIKGVDNLYWFIGGGIHAGFYDGEYYHKKHDDWDDWEDGRFTVVGVDFIIGVEYKLPSAPFAFAVDWKPAWGLNGYNHEHWGDNGSVSARFTF